MNKKTDKRLLSSIDYIDDKFTERAAKRIKERPVGVSGGISKKRMVKYVALLAACMILLGAAIPIATNLINKLPGSIIDPSASNAETTAPEAPLPDEYFCSLNSTTQCKYNGQFIYAIQIEGDPDYCNIVKYDPKKNKVSYVCLNFGCSHSSEKCPLASPEGHGWGINHMEIFGDWLLYDYSYSGADKILLGSTVRLYNLKTGESKTVTEPTLYKYVSSYNSYYVMGGKVYLSFCENETVVDDSYYYGIQYFTGKEYIASYDPETDETVYICDIPEDMGLIGISNKRFFFVKYLDSNNKERYSDSFDKEIWSTDYNGENLRKEDVLDFTLYLSSLNYAYNSDYFGKNAISVYDLLSDSEFEIDFGAKLRYLTVLEDQLLYVTYKSEDKSGGTELWTCDLRGENRTLLCEFEDSEFIPRNRIGNYIVSYKSQTVFNGAATAMRILNLETGEIKTVPMPKGKN